MALVRTANLIRKMQRENQGYDGRVVACLFPSVCLRTAFVCSPPLDMVPPSTPTASDATELESKLQWGTDAQESDAKQLENMNEEDHVKGLMSSGLDASRVEARIALKVSTSTVRGAVSRAEPLS